MNENYIIYAEPVSSIKTIKPVEVKSPRHLNIVYESTSGVVDSIVEFDTDESAQDWRRELLGAFRPGAPKCVFNFALQAHCSCIAGIAVWF